MRKENWILCLVLTQFLLACSDVGLEGGFGSGSQLAPMALSSPQMVFSDDEASLIWTGKESTSEKILFAYAESPTTPSCTNPDVVADASDGVVTVTGLTPNTAYNYAACATHDETSSVMSSAVQGSFTTRPKCDYTLTPLWLDAGANGGNDNGIDSFLEFQTFINAATDLDNSDGLSLKVICLDNVTIRNNNSIAENRIDVNNNDVYIMGKGPNKSLIDNQRDNSNQLAHTNMYIHTETNLSLANLRLTSHGTAGIVVDASNDSSFDILENLEIESFGDGGVDYKVGIFLYTNAVINLIKDVTVTTWGQRGTGLTLLGTGGVATVNKIENVHFRLMGHNNRGIQFIRNDRVLDIENLTITIAGTDSTGIFFDTNGGRIEQMTDSTIRLASTAGGTKRAISMGATGYFNTANISNNVVCALTAIADFTNLLYDQVGTAEYTTNTVNYDGGSNFGVQTFPWGDSSDTNLEGGTPWNLQTQWGGLCP